MQDRIRLQLGQDTQTGKLTPGMAIDEKVLAKSYGTPRTPVREAMREPISIGGKVFADLVLSHKLLEFARLSVDQDDAHCHRGQRTNKTGRDAFTQPERAKQQSKERRQKHKH